MKKISILIFALQVFYSVTTAQPGLPSRLKIFIDCNTTWCDVQYLRSEINIVDFVLDNVSADVHVLVTSQSTGVGGEQYQLIFFGQQHFQSLKDTLRFNVLPNATDFERRDLVLKYLKTGLIPFISKTGDAKYIQITLKVTDTPAAGTVAKNQKDPWNAWVIRVSADGNVDGDANYTHKNYNWNLSANRITDKTKTGMSAGFSRNISGFKYDDSGTTQKLVVDNRSWSINQYVVKSITRHWSWAYELKYTQNTFSNMRGRAFLRLAAEYNLFRYDEVNNKLFTISYGLTARRNHYYDTTIYDKTKELLYGHRATAYLSFTQKWGSSYVGVTYNNYFHNWKLFNLGFDIYSNVRVTGGLSFYVMAYGGLTRDQVFLLKGNATPEEVLARRRQLASGYNYVVSIGINYRFGSNLNNVVNPRFDKSSAMTEE